MPSQSITTIGGLLGVISILVLTIAVGLRNSDYLDYVDYLKSFTGGSSICRTIPGDDAWPSKVDWDQLNQTVHGKLIATVPLAAFVSIRKRREELKSPDMMFVSYRSKNRQAERLLT